MDVHYRNESKWTDDKSDLIIIKDKDGNRYRICQDKFGGLEILVEDGRVSVEPIVANHIVVKTIK